MKTRSLLAAIAVCTLIAGYFVFSGRETHEKGWASSASARASEQDISDAASAKELEAHEVVGKPKSAGAALGVSGLAKAAIADEASTVDALQKASAVPWEMRRDSVSKSIRTLARGQMLVPEGQSLSSSSDSFVKSYSKSLFGVDPSRLLMTKNETTDRTKIVYEETIDGVPVYGATLTMFYENGALTRVQNDLPNAEPVSSGAPAGFSLNQAFLVYQSGQSEANVSLNTTVAAKTILYPQGHELYYAYQFVTDETSKADGKHSSYLVLYDAENPHVIKRASTQTH